MGQPSYGVFGAAFDPPTLGHQNAIEQCRKHFDKVLLVPSAAHAFGKKMTEFKHRMAMLELFCQHWASSQILIEPVEKELLHQRPSKPVYSFDLLEALEQKYQSSNPKLTLILGPDNMVVWDKFYKHQAIDERWGRFGVREDIAVHSVDVRTLLATQPLNDELESTLLEKVPRPVLDYILANNLYRSRPS